MVTNNSGFNSITCLLVSEEGRERERSGKAESKN